MIINVKDIPEDLSGLCLRDEDAREIKEMGFTLESAVMFSKSWATESFAVEVDGEVVALWGYGNTSPLASTAYAWLMTTKAADKYPVRFGRSSRRVVADLLERFVEVRVVVHQRYTLSQKWLEWLGFSYGAEVGDFFEMSKIRETV